MARFNSEADSEFNWLQFLANQEMHALLPENFFANALMEDNSFTALLGLPTASVPHIGGAEVFAAEEDANVNFSADLQRCFAAGQNAPPQQQHFAMSSTSDGSLEGIEPATAGFPAFPSDPAFLERAVKYSSFAKENCQKAEESAPGTVETVMSGNSKEKAFESAVCVKDAKCNRWKKRKALQKAVNSEAPKVKRSKGADSAKAAVEDSDCKAEQSNNIDNCAEKTGEINNLKAPPAPPEKPNYIHVRARRGQATDSHSLAERVRREKISERMKLLQDLVPGCSKITGKALMLDEIINHVQSLQRQVEFLSMKLATVNPLFDFDIDRFGVKEIMTSCPRNPRNGGILTASPYLQYPQPDAQLCTVFNAGFHPARMQPPFNSQVNS
ncbi:hypothetical protein KI387_013817, partial [Taxus chinensis]